MPSTALAALQTAIAEVADLFDPARGMSTSPRRMKRARAVGRAQAVLLSSHFERYFYAVNEEAVAHINTHKVPPVALPLKLKLLHSKKPVDELETTDWENREDKLMSLIGTDGWLWGNCEAGSLEHSRLLAWMSAPKPKYLVRYYRYWGIKDIFSEITRSELTRNKLWLEVQELVDKRNNIAHGDYTAQATPSDIRRYMASVKIFCTRADRRLGRTLKKIASGIPAW